MSCSGNLVQDNSLYVDLPVEFLYANKDSSSGPRHLRAVHHKHYRGFQHLCKFSSTVSPGRVKPVIEASVAFYYSTIGITEMPPE